MQLLGSSGQLQQKCWAETEDIFHILHIARPDIQHYSLNGNISASNIEF